MLRGTGLHFPGDAEGLKENGEVLKFKKERGKLQEVSISVIFLSSIFFLTVMGCN